MGRFRVDVTVSQLIERARSLTIPLLVDTGATYTVLPREIADTLGLQPTDTRSVRLADGREERWPIVPIFVRLGDRQAPSLALIGARGGLALLGAVTLEELALAVDCSGLRLVPTTSMV